jgi:hypothetical protein
MAVNVLDPAFWTGWLTELTLLFKFFLGVLVGAIVLVIIALMNIAFGINIGQYMLEIVKFMVESVKALWMWVISAFHYNNKSEILALAFISFVMFIFILMAFNVNQMGTAQGASAGAGSIRFGSGAVRGSSSGSGATNGTGEYLIGSSSLPSGTLPTITIPATIPPVTVTTTTLPDHCHNNYMDEGEEKTDCGGECYPCHCFVGNGMVHVPVCGISCPNTCYCTNDGFDTNCEHNFCCPAIQSVPQGCWNKCADMEIGGWIVDYNVGLRNCQSEICVTSDLIWVTENGTTMGNLNGLLDWY